MLRDAFSATFNLLLPKLLDRSIFIFKKIVKIEWVKQNKPNRDDEKWKRKNLRKKRHKNIKLFCFELKTKKSNATKRFKKFSCKKCKSVRKWICDFYLWKWNKMKIGNTHAAHADVCRVDRLEIIGSCMEQLNECYRQCTCNWQSTGFNYNENRHETRFCSSLCCIFIFIFHKVVSFWLPCVFCVYRFRLSRYQITGSRKKKTQNERKKN